MTAHHIGLIFHGIGEPRRELEPGEAPFWISRDQFLAVLDRVAALPRRDLIRLSFDDGNLSDFDIGLPALLERGLRADFFVLSGRIGQAGSLDVPHVHALQDASMTIGSHGIAHLNWRSLGDAALKDEVEASRAALEAICGRPVVTAGIPFGSYDRRVLQALRAAGYGCAYSSDRGPMNPGAFLRARTSVRRVMRDADIATILTGRLPPVAALRRRIGMARRRWF